MIVTVPPAERGPAAKDGKKYKVVTKPLDILKPGENKAATTRLNEDVKYNANMIIE